MEHMGSTFVRTSKERYVGRIIFQVAQAAALGRALSAASCIDLKLSWNPNLGRI